LLGAAATVKPAKPLLPDVLAALWMPCFGVSRTSFTMTPASGQSYESATLL
jgi:hypothetical protein